MSTTERQEWLERRRSGIGGSDVAPILGMSKWRTAYDVWLSKTAETPEEDRTTMPMLLGNVLEPEVLRLYEQQTGVSVRRSRDRKSTRLNSSHSSVSRMPSSA